MTHATGAPRPVAADITSGRAVAPAGRLRAAAVAGDYRCGECGYGVTVYRELLRCPMCAATAWERTRGRSRSPRYSPNTGTMTDGTIGEWQEIGASNAGDAAVDEEQVALIVTWFAERGHQLELYVGRDGSHHAAYPVTHNVRHFGLGETRLEAAQQAQATLTAHERRDARVEALAHSRPNR